MYTTVEKNGPVTVTRARRTDASSRFDFLDEEPVVLTDPTIVEAIIRAMTVDVEAYRLKELEKRIRLAGRISDVMTSPIRAAARDYQSIGRRILAVDPLPQGAIIGYSGTSFSFSGVLGGDSRHNGVSIGVTVPIQQDFVNPNPPNAVMGTTTTLTPTNYNRNQPAEIDYEAFMRP